MDSTDDTPTSEGVATLHRIENHIIRTRAAAYTVSRLVEEAFDSPHPSPAARRYDGIALLLDRVTYTGLTIGVVDLLEHATAASDAFTSMTLAGGAE